MKRERERKSSPEYLAAQRGCSQRWRRANPDRVKSYNEDRASDDAARKRTAYAEDRRGKCAKVSAWKSRNPEAKRAQDHARRGRWRDAEGRWTPEDVARLDERQSGLCAYCTAAWEHRDHKTPLARGGSNEASNLQLLCAYHNTSKGARTDAEYRKAMGWARAGKPEPMKEVA